MIISMRDRINSAASVSELRALQRESEGYQQVSANTRTKWRKAFIKRQKELGG